MKKQLLVILKIVIILSLNACGQTGQLYLPSSENSIKLESINI